MRPLLRRRRLTFLVPSVAAVLCLVAGGASGSGLQQPTCFGLAPTLVGTEAPDQLFGTLGPDVIVGLGGDDEINGLSGDDRICGGDGADSLIGLDGNDQIDGGTGIDGIAAGAGDDTLVGGDDVADLGYYLDAPGPVQIDLAAGTAVGHGSDRLSGIEALAGSAFGDLLVGNEAMNFIFPFQGDDQVRGEGGFDVAAFIGPVTADLSTGRSVGDQLNGTDTLAGLEGLTAAAPSTLIGDAGDNYLLGATILRGGAGDDTLVGGAGDQRLDGGPGADSLDGGSGVNVLNGGPGLRDLVTYFTSAQPVRVNLARGRATGDGSDRLTGVESVAGSQFADVIVGSAASNSLYGNRANDRLSGGPGGDYLEGGDGIDTLGGGPGADYCVAGESRSSCEISESGRVGSLALQAQSASYASLRGIVALSRTVCHGRNCQAIAAGLGAMALAIRPAGLESLRQSGPASASDIQYHNQPTCSAAGSRYSVTVEPPTQVALLASPEVGERVRWRAVLRRVDETGKPLARGAPAATTPLLNTQLAGPGILTAGYPTWTPKEFSFSVRGAGRYRWFAEFTWRDSDRTARDAPIRPYRTLPGGRFAQFCEFSASR